MSRFRCLTLWLHYVTSGKIAEWPVEVRSGEQRIAGRVCAIRKSRQAIKRAQRKLDIKMQNGKTVAPETRTYAKYVLVFTTLNAEQATAKQVLEAYRLRWQIPPPPLFCG